MGSKFLVNKNALFFSTHGEIYADLIYSAYLNKELLDDFKLAGFFHNEENLGHVINMEKARLKKCYSIKVNGVGVQDSKSTVYPNQKFVDVNGKALFIKDVKPDDLLVSLNGHVCISYVELIKEDTDFYIIEMDKDMPNIFVDNIIMLAITEEELEEGFFIKSKIK